MTDPLRAEIERLAEEWEKEAARRRKDAARPGEPPSSRRFLECGAAFELTHAAALRAALRSTGSPEPEGGGRERHKRGCASIVSGTCVYLRDGTKVVIKRDGKAAWLEVVEQDVIRPAAPAPEEAATGTREPRR